MHAAKTGSHVPLVTALLLITSLVVSILPPAPVQAYSGGDGTAGNPYQISTISDLVQIRTDAAADATSGKYYRLMNDLDLGGINPWTPIGYQSAHYYKGNFDGNYHVISHLTIGTSSDPDDSLCYLGLFGVNNGTISRLGVADIAIYSSRIYRTDAGGLAGINYGTIANCYTTGSVTGGDSGSYQIFVGGLVGLNDVASIIENCYSTANVTGGDNIGDDDSRIYIGGLAGGNFGPMQNCYATGDVSGGYINSGIISVGGILGGDSTGPDYIYWNSDAAQIMGGAPQVPKRGVGAYQSSGDTSVTKTSAEMKSADFVALLNAHRGANSGWLIVPGKNGGYPILGCTVTFNSNGGSTVDPVITDRDTTISQPSGPTKAGATFEGWYKDAGFTTAWSFSTDTVITDVTLYAKWLETLPSITTAAATSVDISSATLNGNVTAINDTSITERGFDWDTDSGAPYANTWTESGSWSTGAFSHGISSLPAGSTVYFRARAKNNNDAWGYGSELSFLTRPSAPTNVQATDGTETTKVVITWTKSTGASGYQVYRDGLGLGWLSDVAGYDDSGAGSPSINPGTAAATDGAGTTLVSLTLTGASASNGATHTYKVRARNATGESADSSTDTGYRGTTSLTYQWQRSAADSDSAYSDITGAATADYDDTGAPAPTITAGTAAATKGSYTDKVALSLSGESAVAGAGRYYRCVVSMTGATAQNSSSDRGYRGVGILSYQWQRSAADSDAAYSDIPGAGAGTYDDTDGATAPDGRYYKCRLNASGAVEQSTNADRGYQAALVAPSVTTQAATGIGISSATLNMSYTVGDYSPVNVRFAYKLSTDSIWTYTSWVSKPAVGTYTESISGLATSTRYDFKAQLTYNSTTIEGSALQFITGKTSPTVTTQAATGAGTNSATLNMSYTAGDYSPVDVRFAYKKSADPTWTYTSWVSKPADGIHAETLTGLASNTQYDSRGELKYDSSEIAGGMFQFTTGKAAPSVNTRDAVDIKDTRATLNMDFTPGEHSTVEIRFAYKKHALPTWTYTAWVAKSSTGTHAETVTVLTPLTQYDFRADLRYNPEISGNTLQFTTLQTFIGTGPGARAGVPASSSSSIPSSSATISLPPVTLPNIQVQNASLSDGNIKPGASVTVTAAITNCGQAAGNSVIRVYINGEVEAVQAVTLDTGQSKQVSFTICRNEPGNYTVHVNSTPAGSFTVNGHDPDIILFTSMGMILSSLVLGVIYTRKRQERLYKYHRY